METIRALIKWAHQLLPEEQFPERNEEITLILKHVFGVERYEILTHSGDTVSSEKQTEFISIVRERATYKPLAYILGYVPFYHDVFPVSSETLIPRSDTECLIEQARLLFSKPPNSVLDIGTGTGVIALSLRRLFPNSGITALDIVSEPFENSCKALDIDNVGFERMDFLDRKNWQRFSGQKFDLIVSNPPYLSEADMERLEPQVKNFEPQTALYAEDQGLLFYKQIHNFCCEYLAENGYCLLEIDYKWQNVKALFSEKFFIFPPIKDLSGLERCLVIKAQS
ncbi:release factor glutamine methyltransferase [Brevinema andersonii]|uniref:Release factor glutamine methyltransferase n=1 Tax=Brevinema andersonii TaxID=34097 RepID=A0A1I1D9V4_BREAD|nr:peptide chain release factor N(5)-glutamine methyltransferase [Brevinema andersonii]SFB69868.1 release factor glutamine methyltransferase [Brevinema andersonii]